MQYKNRSHQLRNRTLFPFSPFQKILSNQYETMAFDGEHDLNDSLLDGINLSNTTKVTGWIEENYVHNIKVLSDKIKSTKFFLGTQTLAIRDETNKISHIIFIEDDSLILSTILELNEITRSCIHKGNIDRAHLSLNKFTGKCYVTYTVKNENNESLLFINGQEIATSSKTIDFPYMAFCQTSVGQVQISPPDYGLLTYKCRTSGKCFLRTIDQELNVGEEKEIYTETCLGGIDLAISENNILFRVDSIDNNILKTKIAKSNDKGNTISDFKDIDLGDFSPDRFLPANSAVFTDYLGNFHIPVSTLKDGERHLFDVMDDLAVESMILSPKGYGYSLARFPKKPGMEMSIAYLDKGRGDGKTDGMGIIATALDEGKLFASNSQTGGYEYPQESLLNYEMPKILAFKSTDSCYTRFHKPNTVSMDYIFIECDEMGMPISNKLLFETWDMPLPIPLIEAYAKNQDIIINIKKDGWFEQGSSLFQLNDPTINIENIDYLSDRSIRIKTDSLSLKGKTISFETKNHFYWHKGTTTIL